MTIEPPVDAWVEAEYMPTIYKSVDSTVVVTREERVIIPNPPPPPPIPEPVTVVLVPTLVVTVSVTASLILTPVTIPTIVKPIPLPPAPPSTPVYIPPTSNLPTEQLVVWARDIGLADGNANMIRFPVPAGSNAALNSMQLGILDPVINPVGWQTMINAQKILYQNSLSAPSTFVNVGIAINNQVTNTNSAWNSKPSL